MTGQADTSPAALRALADEVGADPAWGTRQDCWAVARVLRAVADEKEDQVDALEKAERSALAWGDSYGRYAAAAIRALKAKTP
jgi:hypothetical protein